MIKHYVYLNTFIYYIYSTLKKDDQKVPFIIIILTNTFSRGEKIINIYIQISCCPFSIHYYNKKVAAHFLFSIPKVIISQMNEREGQSPSTFAINTRAEFIHPHNSFLLKLY